MATCDPKAATYNSSYPLTSGSSCPLKHAQSWTRLFQKGQQEQATERTIPAMAARCALSAPSSVVRQPLYGNKLAKNLTPCLPSPRAVRVRVNAAKLPPGVSEKRIKKWFW